MIVEMERKRVRRVFIYEHQIREAVEEAIAALNEKESHGKTLSHDDPTAATVIKRNTKLKKVFYTINNKTIRTRMLEHPQEWLQVLEDIYELYDGQLIAELMRQRATGKSPEVIADFSNVGLNTFYRWERELLDDAILLATERNIIKPSLYTGDNDE